MPKRKCPNCGLETPITVEGPYGPVEVDACFRDMLGAVVNACCGHGDPRKAYVRIDRVHSNGTDGFVDICGGEVVDYATWLDRSLPERLVEANLNEAEQAHYDRLVSEKRWSPSVALSNTLWHREHGVAL